MIICQHIHAALYSCQTVCIYLCNFKADYCYKVGSLYDGLHRSLSSMVTSKAICFEVNIKETIKLTGLFLKFCSFYRFLVKEKCKN